MADLTPRQREVLRLLAEGLQDMEIAERMGITLHTVKTGVHDIRSRLGMEGSTRVELVLAITGGAGNPGAGSSAVAGRPDTRAALDGDRPVGAREAAALLGVHVNTVKRIPAAELPYFRVAARGDRRYLPDDVAAYAGRRAER